MAKGRTAFQREIDDTLTENFNNIPEVRCFLLSKIAKLIKHLEESYGDDIRIFIKGGSSLNIMKKVVSDIDPTKWSDFDNQIIINPNLPVYRWYQILSEVHGYLKEEYMPRFQQDWEAFLTCNRKELDDFQQKGLKLFKGKLIENKIFDYPTLKFTMSTPPAPEQEKSSKAPEKKQDNEPKAPLPKGQNSLQQESELQSVQQLVEPEVEVKPKKQEYILNLALEKGIQSNIVFNSGMALLHPLNHFDNAMMIPEISGSILKVLEQQGLHQDEVFYNAYFPPAPMAMDVNQTANENPYSSSILINTSISKFLLYRVVVRYRTKDYHSDGTPKLLADGEYALGKEQKVIDSRSIVKFRGELLDISIPRRDSYETIQQWMQVKTMPLLYRPGEGHNALWVNVPDWRYQLNENVLLILEVFGNMSGSPHKFYKRVMRGCNAVEAIYQSYNSRFDQTQIKTLEQKIISDNFKKAFNALLQNKELEFLTPLVVDLFNVIQDDYLWKSIGPALAEFKALKSVDIEQLIGQDIAATLKENWDNLAHKNPDTSSSDTYDAILIKEVKNKDSKHGDRNYEKAKNMLGFMKLYEDVHQQFKVQLEFLDQAKSCKDISIVNRLRQTIEELPFVESCTFCGLLSSMIHMKSITGKGLFDYHYPFVELFAISEDKEAVAKLIQTLNKTMSGCLAKEYIPFDKGDVTALPSVQLYYAGFDLPIVIRFIDKLDEKEAYRGAKVFEVNELEITKRLRALRLSISGTRKQLVHVFDQQNLNKEALERKLEQDRQQVNEIIDTANVNSYQKQLLLTFNHLSSAEFIGQDGVYRILLAPEAIKHMDLKIAYTASFFQMHWLDHHRVEYKNTVTRFPPQRIDIGSGDVNIYSSLNTYKAPISYSSISKSDFSKPVVYVNTTADQAILDIARDKSWSNIGGDIAPLLMSQMLGFPIEVASAASPEDVLLGRLRQVHRFDQRLAQDYSHTPFAVPMQPLSLAGVPQAMTGPAPQILTLAKIGNHYWVREPDGGLTNMPRDGNCFYHAILSYFVNSPQKTTDNLRAALSDYANQQHLIVQGNTTRLQYIIDNIGAIENSFRPVVGYQEVAIRDRDAVYRGLIRNLKAYLVDDLAQRVIVEDQLRVHEILRDIDAVHNWDNHRLNLIAAARNFALSGNRPQSNTLPTDNELGLV
ncbi:OTU domain-containing protein [Thalassomonas sp. RHCl1]|uniref:OTU domain-containing protein n=1 Tax=Thalassomonas sp. RHCl1 TaxID=2995320 RepID=UPI00248C16CD|nr:OTU domain-containing protein [Thalassomonas sp. RHCl1]